MKKNLKYVSVIFLIALVFILTISNAYMLGDVNGNEKVDSADLTVLAKHVANILPITDADLISASDVNCDNKVDSQDLTILAKYVANIIDTLGEIILQDFESTQSDFTQLDLTSFNAEPAKISYTTAEGESGKAMLAQLTEAKSAGYAQTYQLKNINSKMKQVNEKYYIRMYISVADDTDYKLSCLLYDGKSLNYVKAFSLISSYGDTTELSYTNVGYGTPTAVIVPRGFKGWVSFSLSDIYSTIADGGTIVNIEDVNEMRIDVRASKPSKDSYYILDNVVLTTKTTGTSFNNKYEYTYHSKNVGILYAVWFNANKECYNSNKIYNIYNAINGIHEDGVEDGWPEKNNIMMYWGKPALGYYDSDDKDVIRTHLEQLAEAEVDFIYIDLSNLWVSDINKTSNSASQWANAVEWMYAPYKKSINALLEVACEMENEGVDIPRIIPFVYASTSQTALDQRGKATDSSVECSEELVDRIYNEFMKNEKYENLWVYENGQPMMFTTVLLNEVSVPVSTRCVYALFAAKGGTYNGQWTWREGDNSTYGKDYEGNLEEMCACPAKSLSVITAADAIGRNGGKTFYNDWKNIFENQPKTVLVGSWNQWQAAINYKSDGSYYFVDEYSQELSDDIEPMEGGHEDTYYKWLCDYVVKYKTNQSCPENYDS